MGYVAGSKTRRPFEGVHLPTMNLQAYTLYRALKIIHVRLPTMNLGAYTLNKVVKLTPLLVLGALGRP